jgi:hypothetical protein
MQYLIEMPRDKSHYWGRASFAIHSNTFGNIIYISTEMSVNYQTCGAEIFNRSRMST